MIEFKRYQKEDVSEFLLLCKKAYPAHNVFYKSLEEVKKYLDRKDKENSELGGVFFAYDKNKVIGGALLKIEEKTINNKHIRFKYNHLVGKDEKVKKEIMDFLDSKIRKHIKDGKIKTAKIEAALSENEADLEFYKKNGFKIEGELASHYRPNEKAYVLGKEIK
ncbi:MAG: hypothetical protein Q7J54_07185 [Candidatus Woesearchaeota archaeon]|nr:hypothetical protein [Candidatus Woesearchaeota archaeon]